MRDTAVSEVPEIDRLAAARFTEGMNQDYVDEREVSRRTTISTRKLQAMRHERVYRGPPFAKIGKRVLYKWADVERWIADHTKETGTEWLAPAAAEASDG